MNHRAKDGIRFEQAVYIIDDNKPGYPYLMRAIQYLAMLAAAWSAVSILIDSFLIPADKIQLYLALWITVTVSYGLFLLPSLDLVKLFFLCLFYGLFFYSRWERIQNGFFLLENFIIYQLESYFNVNLITYKADKSAAAADITLLLIMIMIPVIVLTAIAVHRFQLIVICSILYFIPIAGSFIVGIIPSDGKMIVFLISILFLLKGSGSVHHILDKLQKTRHQRIRNNAALVLCMASLLLYAILHIFISQQDYDKVTGIREAKSDLQSYLYNFSLEDFMNQISIFPFGHNTAVGGLSGGKLGKVDEIKYTKKEQLKVTAPVSPVRDGIYLKGYVGCVYTGDSWEGYDKELREKYETLLKKLPAGIFSPINQNRNFMDLLIKNNYLDSQWDSNGNQRLLMTDALLRNQYTILSGTMKLEYTNSREKFLYLPYGIDADELSNIKYEQDLYIQPVIKKKEFEIQFSYNMNLVNTLPQYYDLSQSFGEYAYYERLYRNYVYDVYTRLPQKGLDQLKQDFINPEGFGGEVSILDKINYVKNYLNSTTSYSLSPGKLPKGKDFVEYFLYESHKGYCSHYASAAALMLRAMGVPARYVEGYAAGPNDIVNEDMGDQTIEIITDTYKKSIDEEQVELSIKDSNAHAWVEVYMDGFGWVPIEFTPGAVESNLTSDEFGDILTRGEDINQSIIPQVPPAQVTIPPTQAPITLSPGAGQEQNRGKEEENKENQMYGPDRILLYSLAAFIVCAGLLAVLYKRSKPWNPVNNNNGKALHLYRKTEKMLLLSKSLPRKQRLLEEHMEYVLEHCTYIEKDSFQEFMDLVWKARFGRNVIETDDLERLKNYYRELFHKIYHDLSLPRKMHCKLMLFLRCY